MLYNAFYPAPNAETNLTGGRKDDIVFATSAHSLNADLGGGNDRVYGSYGADRIYGGAGNDVLNGSAYVPAGKPASETAGDRDLIIGGAGRDLIYGVAGDDVIYSEEKGSHLLETDSTERGDWVVAGEGDDEVYGSTNRDLLTGSEGSDTVFGGAGDDVVLGDGFLRFGNRSQSVYVESPAASFDYTVVSPIMPFVPGILVPTVSTAPASRLTAEFTYDGNQWKETGINSASLTHANMDAWEIEINRETDDYALTAKVPLNEAFHRVAAGGSADFLYGGSGNDLVVGQDGNDYVIGGKGNDILWGDDNRDPSVAGHDYLEGGDGDDKLYGGKGDDTLVAGKGRDMLEGGEGYDIYSFDSTDLQNPYDAKTIVDIDGQGMIVLDGKSLHTAVWTADSEQSGRWTSAQGWQLDLHGSRLLLTGKTFSSQIAVENFSDGMFGLNLTAAENRTPEAQGRLKTVFIQTGQEWAYTLPAGHFSDPDGDTLDYRITLADGSRLPDGLAFDADTLTVSGTAAEAGTLKLAVTADDGRGKSVSSLLEVKVLEAGNRENQVLTGTDGSDRLHSGFGRDVLAGGAGDDTLIGGFNSSDTYLFTLGHGKDTVIDATYHYGRDTDTLHFEAANAEDARFSRSGNDLTVKAYGGEDSVTVANYFQSAGFRSMDFVFADKTVNAESMKKVALAIYGGNDSAVLQGWNGSDVISGGSGSEKIYGYAGSDTINGGGGNDELHGGDNAADTYVFAKGHGSDMIFDGSVRLDAFIDRLVFEEAVLADAQFSRSGSDLQIRAFGGSDQVSISGYYTSAKHQAVSLAFADSVLNPLEVKNLAQNVA
ncbi:putative Ig domain-containing protein [Neisseria sp.]|uniref:putative Ig domain-containing protein n=1 Tax=Neisseria sp. TaxID=192066 RepID=UPI0035A0286F